MGTVTLVKDAPGAVAPSAQTDAPPKARRTWARRPKPDGDGASAGVAKKRRGGKPVRRASVFGAQSAQFDSMVLRAEVARVMAAHLEAMREEFGRLAADNQDVCARLIAVMAQSGMNALQGFELVPKPDPARANTNAAV